MNFIVLILLISAGCNDEPKKPTANVAFQSRHNSSLNAQLDTSLAIYDSLKEDLVNWDSTSVISHAVALQNVLEKLKSEQLSFPNADIEMQPTANKILDEAITTLTPIIKSGISMESKKHAFNSVSNSFYQYLAYIEYDRKKIYFQLCPMAFNDVDSGFWLSKTRDIRNPYLGLHHPRYRKAMIECGEIKDSINFAK